MVIYFKFRTWPFIIKSPKQYKNLSFMDAMNKFKWTKKEGVAFNKLVLSLPVNVRCSKTDNAEWSVRPYFVSIFRETKCYFLPESITDKIQGTDKYPHIQWSSCLWICLRICWFSDGLE